MKKLIPILTCLVVVGCSGCLGPKLQKPHSDVPVIHRIGWWAHQEGLSVTNFSIEVVDAPLHLLNSKALIRMHITGTVQNVNGWRPFIKYVHIGERFDPASTNTDPVADFLVTPVVEVKTDKKYSSETLPFDLNVETYFQTFKWQQNQYKIQCGSFKTNLTLRQIK